MAIFRFRLKTLLNVKVQLEKSAKNELGIAVSFLELQKQELYILENERKNLDQDFLLSVSGRIDQEHIQTIKNRILVVEKHRIVQIQKVKEASDAVDKIRDRVVILMQERKVLENLKDKEFEQFRIEELHEEQRLADELVTHRSSANREAAEDIS